MGEVSTPPELMAKYKESGYQYITESDLEFIECASAIWSRNWARSRHGVYPETVNWFAGGLGKNHLPPR